LVVAQYCGGGELYGLLMSQPNKRLQEAHMKFYVAEILLALQYLHLLGFVYRCSCFPPSSVVQHLSDRLQCSST
jgi:serine/threonine protein kinase